MRPLIRLIATLAAVVIGASLMSSATTANAATTSTKTAKVQVGRDQLRPATNPDANTVNFCGRCRVPHCFAAISMSPDQAYGWANDRNARYKAVRAAHRNCRAQSNYPGRCTKMGSVGNGCMAVAIKTNSYGWITKWRTGFGKSLRSAKRQAKNRNHGGRIRAAVCTTRRY